MGLQLLFLIFFAMLSYKQLPFGTLACIIMNWFNICGYLVWKYVINPPMKPINDPGIVIWWLCCLRVGHTKKFQRS